jgi:RHS repeat-associated protein
VYYIHTDHLNTPRRISDNQIVWRWDNDPFGRHTANEDPDGDSQLFTFSLRYPGQYYDEETGLHYNYFRDYDPSTGRYIQSDPIRLEGGLNTYAYVGGNPTAYVDPLGLETNVFMHTGAGSGGSSMDHVATDINGTTYTYGPDDMTVLPTDQYLERNDFRDTKALKLNLTFAQEE